MKQVDFIKLEDEIRQILIEDEVARSDDMYLYWVYCNKRLKEQKQAIFESLFLSPTTRKTYNIKSYHSVSRCRRKIQEHTPDLASERSKRLRAKEEKDYKEYANC